MTRIKGLMVLLILLGAACAHRRALATTRADFFDVSRRPSVQFDRKTLTWTLRNLAIERVVRFDARVGGLKTTAFRDIKHNWSLPVEGTFEGSFAFASPIVGMPAPISAWKTVAASPSAAWVKPEFDDSSWSTYEPGGDAKARWFRGRVPTGLMTDLHPWALLFDRALHGEIDVYFDGVLGQKITGADHPAERLLEVDIPAATRLIAIKMTDPNAPADFTGSVSLSQVGTSPPNVELNQDWKYVLHAINTNENGSLILSISLSGLKRYEGFDVDVYYQIYPGDEPFCVKWFTFASHRATRFILDEVIFDRFPLPGASHVMQSFAGSAVAASEPRAGNGLLGGVLALSGRGEKSADGQRVSILDRPGCLLRPNVPQDTARSVVALYRGPTAAGAFLYQLYIGEYIAHATPTSVPNAYNTWYGYKDAVSANTCERIIPLAAGLGVGLFVLDHGWETNAVPDSGTLGDWVTDHGPLKFPNGLIPISLMVREHNMRFGLWTAPTAVNEKSQAAASHASWLLREPSNLPVPAFDGASRMCFTSGWADNYTGSFRDLCREIGATYLKVDGKLFHDFCCDPAHDHPVGRALATQEEYWGRFCAEMRRIDPDFVINRSTEGGAEVTALQDEGIGADWEIEKDPKRTADNAWWYKNADLCRGALYDLAWTRPPFTLECEAPCHIPTVTGDLNALEYHLTSAGAYVSNMEIHGRLDDMKPEEQALVKKWLRWNEENRPWLAYSQPLPAQGRPWNPTAAGESPHVDGILHLRNALQGRYGYVCLWNPANVPAATTVAIRPSDYLVKLASGLEVVSVRDGRSIPVTVQNGLVTLSALPLAPRSWEIYEIRQSGRGRAR